MNGKFEEQLAQLAFGDLSPEESARLEHLAERDPRAQECLEEFRQMRSCLRRMADDVPAHQLSNERLRAAILKGGLNEKPAPRRVFQWQLWASYGAAAILCVVTVNRVTSAPSTVSKGLVAQNSQPKLATPSVDGSVNRMVLSDSTASAEGPVAGSTTLALAALASKPLPKPVRAQVRRKVREDNGWMRTAVASAAPVREESPSTVEDLSPKPPTRTVDNINGTSPAIVMIQPDTDLDTGAARATEESNSNVLVGG